MAYRVFPWLLLLSCLVFGASSASAQTHLLHPDAVHLARAAGGVHQTALLPNPDDAPPVSHLTLVSALSLSPQNRGVHADVATYKDLAFVGKWAGPCPGSGVDIIDIADPAAPVKIAHTEEHANTSMEKMRPLRVGERDVLGIGLQDCHRPGSPAGKSGLELVDISDPHTPRTLSIFDIDTLGAHVGGVHELDLTTAPGGRALALLAVPNLEARTADDTASGGKGDLVIVDISDPAHPVLTSTWGILGDPALGPSLAARVRYGSDARTLLHSVRASRDGTRAYLSYWDAGVILLDIHDPAKPLYVGRTSFQPGEEGNAHSVSEANDGNVLVQADEVLDPYTLSISSPSFPGSRGAGRASYGPSITSHGDGGVTGQVVPVGRGCPAGSINGLFAADPYPPDVRGHIALIERGSCHFDQKTAEAQRAGATAAIIYNSDDPQTHGEEVLGMAGESSVRLSDGASVTITIPTISVQRSVGLLLRDATPPATVTAAITFGSWGYLRLFDVHDPSQPKQISTVTTPETKDEAAAKRGTWSVHNPEVQGSTVFASWYNDGVRAIDISNPTLPREIGFWKGEGLPDGTPPVEIWGVALHGNLILASDLNYGLFILRYQP